MSQIPNNNHKQGTEKCFFRVLAEDFNKIPGTPIAYWINEKIAKSFEEDTPLNKILDIRAGMSTTDNQLFLRQWFEVNRKDISTFSNSKEVAATSNCRWFPYIKGGPFRKWFGNNDFVVNWKNDGEDIKKYIADRPEKQVGGRLVNMECFFKECLAWTRISSSSFSSRYYPSGSIFSDASNGGFGKTEDIQRTLLFLNTSIVSKILAVISPTINFYAGDIGKLPTKNSFGDVKIFVQLVKYSRNDWNAYEISWDFTSPPLLNSDYRHSSLEFDYQKLRTHWHELTLKMQQLEEENNRIFIEAYGLEDELTADVPLKEITLTCNPHYRYSGDRTDEELETLLQCDTIKELVSYAIGCMMGRYSLDKSGLILASQGETIDDYSNQIPVTSFAPDEDGILPLNDLEWFADDATNRLREFVRVVWGEDSLQQNLNFIAESLCLHAIRTRRGESSLDCIRRYLSTQFFKDHMRMYKNRPIYWLFSSGKHKAFECLVYLHRYNEGTLARMRTEYLIPLSAKLKSYAEKLEQDKEASTSAAEIKSLEKQITDLHNQQAELAEYDEQLRHYADQRIQLDLDDGVKVNYGKFGTLLAEVKKIAGE